MERSFRTSLIATALLLLSPSASSTESVFVGRVEQVLVLPKGHARCQCSAPPGKICVSNSCGCAEASVTPSKALVGPLPGGPLVVLERLDEWCRLPIHPDSELVVRQLSPSDVAWTPIEMGPHGPEFDASAFPAIGSLPISEVPAEEGRIPLAELVRRLGL